ncbi:magnesium protoporphyrin IX methyltransferase [Rhodoblastus sphagnicola]|uniref:Magnesium protoporphyrin IX methyltransferase n=1 Tax=Rhodoblastus sphagnicola TaxID=333368 RepID=A0A2S6NCD6_9HYPH|nr:magnesium protoporphyrin IX methyltransferase [Rhodoblastus sphagnicola]MBB4196826.1 magnesium-protoporphyrin O-methyltransferase [Rhodoblastus sphagnicola]PPQ32267.1 magnesium protoporphyrin IX methyltransferase [Rhodoblastus sphagnicola]
MADLTYHNKREELRHYFDRTAVEAWRRLTSDEPVGSVRATVRAGRDEMRANLLSWLPADPKGARILDAGCGSGALAVELARRGADVVATDISPTLVDLAKERSAAEPFADQIDWRVGDFLSPDLGAFDYVVAMDSLIHYDGADIAKALETLAARTSQAIVFTIAPRTTLLTLMHAVGKFFPRGDRSPAIAPISQAALARDMQRQAGLANWRLTRSHRVARGFYISEALEARPA